MWLVHFVVLFWAVYLLYQIFGKERGAKMVTLILLLLAIAKYVLFHA